MLIWPRRLFVAIVVVVVSFAIGLATELLRLIRPDGNLLILLLVVGMFLVLLAVALVEDRPTIAAGTGALLN